jgi:hypothetical protein
MAWCCEKSGRAAAFLRSWSCCKPHNVLLDGDARPRCRQVAEVSASKTGKHGHTKVFILAVDLATQEQLSWAGASHLELRIGMHVMSWQVISDVM